MNDEVHTFRIRNCVTGTEKVVHRNLFRTKFQEMILPRMLPRVGQSLSVSENAELRLPVNEPDERTVAWVLELPGSEVDLSEFDSVQLIADEQSTGLSVPHATSLNGQTEGRSLTCEPDVDGSINQADADVHTDTVATDHLLQCSREPSTQGGSLTVKTRCGRVVKPVIRLIQNMHQKVMFGL